MAQLNFLIGRGELLTRDISGPKRKMEKSEVYSLAETAERLLPQIERTLTAIEASSPSTRPDGLAVARIMLNPSYIARSFYPASLFRTLGLIPVGSRATKVIPKKWNRKRAPSEISTTEFFVAGRLDDFRKLSSVATTYSIDSKEALDFTRVEQVNPYLPSEKIVNLGSDLDKHFEVGIHLLPDDRPDGVKRAFEGFAEDQGAITHNELSFETGNLWFIPVECSRLQAQAIAEFALVRVIRPVPKLRTFRPVQRGTFAAPSCRLPTVPPVSSEPRVAILDGGLPENHPLTPWVRTYRHGDPDASNHPEGPNHGLAVTSALLFGAIEPGSEATQPYSYVDHHRVLDSSTTAEDPLELYRTLGMIEEVLLSRRYQFINLSLGPDLPIEDSDIHAWTSVIDDLLSDGNTLMTVAVGNNGERDRTIGNARVQVPSDCVNAISVGSCNNLRAPWQRAAYSAVGPGRHPGLIKPDLMAFGGQAPNYFHAVAAEGESLLQPLMGTSFAAPALLRIAVGVRATLGTSLGPLAIKALLVHSAERAGHQPDDVGWGKIPEDLGSVIACPPGVARIVYQGELKPGKYLRAALPVPDGGLKGRIRLKATFCCASPTDPQDTSSYTRAGLEVTFRPKDSNVKQEAKNASSRSFFKRPRFADESEQRADQGKWETVLHGESGLLGTSLKNPVFDIHYNAREGGHQSTGAEKIPYALVITVEAPNHPDIYNDILRAYSDTLVGIRPVEVTLPVRS